MRVFRGCISANIGGTERMVFGVTGTIETIEICADLMRKAYNLSIRDVKISVEFIGSVEHVD